MCGIIGIVGGENISPSLLEGLKRLEYRGYDSAGIATLIDGHIHRRRAEGKLINLENALDNNPLGGKIGIGHTRWATHGAPTENNAHPHSTEKVAIVHNGIIENFQPLRNELKSKGRVFKTDTDTEVVAHLISEYMESGLSSKEAMAKTIQRLEGAFAIAVIIAGESDKMLCARRGSPLVVGFGDGQMYIGSDALALAPLTNQLCYLEEGDWAIVTQDNVEIFNSFDEFVQRPVVQSSYSGAMIGKGNHRHFMHKEIFEQPTVIGDTLESYVNREERKVALPELPFSFKDVPKITIVACGTAYYAGFVAKYWLESIAKIPVEVDIASEFRYREGPLPENGVAIFVSQSGETIDTLEALRYAKKCNQHILSIVNVKESTIARESDAIIQTLAGPEIGVASTKAFTTQLVVLATLSLKAALENEKLSEKDCSKIIGALAEIPSLAVQALQLDDQLQKISTILSEAKDVLFLGRGTSFALALEGALKLKEISYIHAEGHAAGEMKHGPIALIEDTVPVIFVAPSDKWFEKTASNVQEVLSRGGKVILISDKKGLDVFKETSVETIELPSVHEFTSPLLYVLPLQLLAYHTAVLKGTDVDQPRNLAKSVTVE